MPQQVWAFLATTDGGAFAASDLAQRLKMPLATVRGQLRRLELDGKVARLEGRYHGKVVYRRSA